MNVIDDGGYHFLFQWNWGRIFGELNNKHVACDRRQPCYRSSNIIVSIYFLPLGNFIQILWNREKPISLHVLMRQNLVRLFVIWLNFPDVHLHMCTLLTNKQFYSNIYEKSIKNKWEKTSKDIDAIYFIIIKDAKITTKIQSCVSSNWYSDNNKISFNLPRLKPSLYLYLRSLSQ